MNRLRPRTTVLSGALVGLIAGAAVYGAVASSVVPTKPTVFKAARAPAAAPATAARTKPARAAAAPCAGGEKLEKGVCIVHVVRTVFLPAPSSPVSSSPAAAIVPAVFSPRKATSARRPSAGVTTSRPHAAASPRGISSLVGASAVRAGAAVAEPAGQEAGRSEHAREADEHAKDAAEHARERAAKENAKRQEHSGDSHSQQHSGGDGEHAGHSGDAGHGSSDGGHGGHGDHGDKHDD